MAGRKPRPAHRRRHSGLPPRGGPRDQPHRHHQGVPVLPSNLGSVRTSLRTESRRVTGNRARSGRAEGAESSPLAVLGGCRDKQYRAGGARVGTARPTGVGCAKYVRRVTSQTRCPYDHGGEDAPATTDRLIPTPLAHRTSRRPTPYPDTPRRRRLAGRTLRHANRTVVAPGRAVTGGLPARAQMTAPHNHGVAAIVSRSRTAPRRLLACRSGASAWLRGARRLSERRRAHCGASGRLRAGRPTRTGRRSWRCRCRRTWRGRRVEGSRPGSGRDRPS